VLVPVENLFKPEFTKFLRDDVSRKIEITRGLRMRRKFHPPFKISFFQFSEV
jgi:hypothetical protein